MKKHIVIIVLSLLIVGCSKVEEIIIKTSVKYQLSEMCGEHDECANTLDTCLDKMEWGVLIKHIDDEVRVEEMMRNTVVPCLVQTEGSPFTAEDFE